MRKTPVTITLRYIFLLSLFAGFVTAGGFLAHGKLYWDTGKIFTELRDQWHSLNAFGEPAWWFPHVQSGMPGYYHSMIGLPSCLNPIFALTGLAVWVLGRCGIYLQKFQPLYVFYFGFLIPFFFLHSFWLLAKRLFRNEWVVQYTLILAAFSPGILFNLSDVGYLEPCIYSLYFAAAYWDFIQRKTESPSLLLLSWGVLVLSFNHGALYWNLFAVPLFLVLTPRERLRVVGKQLTPTFWLMFIAVTVICFAPNAWVYLQGKDLVRSTLGETLQYPIERLAAGNPLEIFSVSTPGFGFDWNSDRTRWTWMALSPKYHTAYYYLGLLALPLFMTGLLFGNRRTRTALFLFVLVFMGILPLAAHSPFFAPLFLVGPLKSCNHFSDAAFKAGAFLLVIIGAGLGLRTVIAMRARKTLLLFFVGMCAVSAYFQIKTYGTAAASATPFGLFLFCAVFMSVVLVWLLRAKKLRLSGILRLILLLTLLDVGTHSFLWVRNVWRSELVLGSGWPAYHVIDETPSIDGLGIRVGKDSHFYSTVLLMLRPYYQMLREGRNPFSLPEFALHSADQIIPGKIATIRRTYNDWELEVEAKEPAMLFLRDGYSPYWTATVNGKSILPRRALENFKEVELPRGRSHVVLRFSPPGVALVCFLAYALLLGLAAIAISEKLGLRSGISQGFQDIIKKPLTAP